MSEFEKKRGARASRSPRLASRQTHLNQGEQNPGERREAPRTVTGTVALLFPPRQTSVKPTLKVTSADKSLQTA